MASSTPNGAEPVEDFDAVKPPAGIIVPPKAIRDNIHTTGNYFQRKGETVAARVEAQMKEKNFNNPKFSFLFPQDAYHPYYTWYLAELRAGKINPVDGQGQQTKAPEKPKGPPPPAEFHFSARMPNISAQDLEIIKLTAKYTAYKGRGWMNQLLTRESSNYQFDFLRTSHSLHQFFSRLVDQYADLKNAGINDDGKVEKERITELKHNVEDRFHVLDRAKLQAEYFRYQDKQKQKEVEQQEKEKLEYAQIDWHDFVVVATITFDEADETAEMSAPWNLNDIQSQTMEQKAARSINPNMRIEEAVPGDETYYVVGQQPGQAPPVQPAWPAQQPQQPVQPASYPYPVQQNQEDDEARYIRERQEERDRAQQLQAAAKGTSGSMRIRNDYVPRAAQAKKQNTGLALCPNCGQQVPFNELEQHMRIELLDPNWKEQKAREAQRYATTNLSTADVANNLKRLASQRDDVFDGITGQPISEEEQARRKKAAMSYDGQPDARGMQQMQTLNVEEQLRQIKQKYTT